jgi:2-methoxy-6-polyprenyl-1,4-benzoquinol methylase
MPCAFAGFQTVARQEKESLVRQVFSNVASSYDVMNDLMSCGLHRLWKDRWVGQAGTPAAVLGPGQNRGGVDCDIRAVVSMCRACPRVKC